MRSGSPRLLVAALLALPLAAPRAGALLRTGMAEVGARAWTVARTTLDGRNVDQSLAGLSASWFLSDNVSLGVEASTFAGSPFSDSVVLDGRARLYWWPLRRLTPWTSMGAGGVFGLPEGNAIRAFAALGLRWIPHVAGDRLALDLQLVGVERWRQDWAAEYIDEDKPQGRIEWSMARSPWPTARHGVFGHSSPLAWPVLGVSLLF